MSFTLPCRHSAGWMAVGHVSVADVATTLVVPVLPAVADTRCTGQLFKH